MALIKLGAIAQDIRGTLNGNVFSRNRGGAYVRSKVSPLQPVSEASSRSRAMFKAVSQRFAQELDEMQANAWDVFAATHPYLNVFGDSIILTGVAMFQALNRRNRECGEAWLDDPPATFVVEDLGDIAVALTASGGALAGTITPARTVYAPQGLYVFITPPLCGNRKAANSDFRMINNQDLGLIAGGADIATYALARFPYQTWTTGDRVALKIAALDTDTGAISHAATVLATLG
jgi:hypothetical protein